jgi:predicted MPP superfamily phosphohydrolase
MVILLFSILGAIRYLGAKLILKRERRKYFYINKLGAVLAFVLFMIMLYGFSIGRYDYRVKTVEIFSDKISEEFDGFKIVQISDFHLGSFAENYKGVHKAVEMVNAQEPDIIAFTGDMVNTFSSEMLPWMDELKNFKAKYGTYSVLGNHDYGHYVHWDDPKKDSLNIANLKIYQKECGFRLLMNENRTIKINNEYINILGVENWGLPPFPSYGKLGKALEGVNTNKFTLLLSHDSNHWDAEVKKTEIDLMMAGHTHAMQMGIEIGSFKWSPSKYIYKYWDGLYSEANKYLYVNRGLGYIAFPGRILQRPEITVIILRKK